MKKLILLSLISLNLTACATADVERFMQGMAMAGQQQQYSTGFQPVNSNQPKQYQCTTRTVGSPWGAQRQVVTCN